MGKNTDGLTEYNNRLEKQIIKVIHNNPQYDFLEGLYYEYSSMGIGSLQTKKQYLYKTISFLNYVNKDVKDLTRMDYVSYLHTLNDMTINHRVVIYAVLKKLAIFLEVNGINTNNPFNGENGIKKPKGRESVETKQKRDNGKLTKEELKKYMDNVRNENNIFSKKSKNYERNMAIVQIFLTTGLRCSAVSKLDVEDIDFEKKFLKTLEKGSKARRIALNDETLKVISKWLKARKKFITSDTEDNKALFIGKRKNRLTSDGIYRVIENFGKDITGKHITPHKLRHTYATMLYEADHDIVRVQHALGHASVSTTQLYINTDYEEESRENAELMSGIAF